MNVVLLIGVLGILLLVIAHLLLMNSAFGVSKRWGWLVALVPLSDPVFIIRQWSQSRVPFFAGLVALLFVAISGYGVCADEPARIAFDSAVQSVIGKEGAGSRVEGGKAASNRGAVTSVDQLVGMSLKDVTALYGDAEGTMNHGGVKVFVYPMFTLESSDGKTVSRYQKF